MKRVVIFDIDGTIADNSHRIHLLKTKPKQWYAYVAGIEQDNPIPHIIELLNLFYRNFYTIVLVTGRSLDEQKATENWLIKHDLYNKITKVYMRRSKDFRADYVIKREILEQMREEGYEPIMVFEDRTQVVEMWRSLGIPCLQVKEGNF